MSKFQCLKHTDRKKKKNNTLTYNVWEKNIPHKALMNTSAGGIVSCVDI